MPPLSGRPGASTASRADSLIVFGLPEAKSLPDLRQSVDELLTFLVGRSVPLNDLFRLGRLKQPDVPMASPLARPRPIILKLASAWDRRLVLSAVRELKGYSTKRIFIREDLSPEERQKRKEKGRARNPPAADADRVRAEVSALGLVQSPGASNGTSSGINQDS